MNGRSAQSMGLCLLLLVSLAAGVQAQTTSTVPSLFLSPGAEIDLSLYGTPGGIGTNETHSDRIAVQGLFASTNPSSASTYTLGFGLGDDTRLALGGNFTVVTFASTNFPDASKFRAAPRGNGLKSIDGIFTLVLPGASNGQEGSLVFTLGSYATIPEPASLLLFVIALSLSGRLILRPDLE